MDTETIIRTKGDLNFNSLNYGQSLNSAAYKTHQSQKSSDIEKTLSLSIQSNNLFNIDIKDIIALYEQIDQTLFNSEQSCYYILAERNHFTDISQIENQRLVLHKSNNSLILTGFMPQSLQMIVIKQLGSNCQENLIKKLDEYKIHAKMNKTFPSSSLQLITPICVEKNLDNYNIEACMERAEFNLYDYSRKYQISKQDAFNIFVQLIGQIINMYSINIAHRDVKPQNIFYVKDKGWLLSDFGESQQFEIVNSTYSIRGTRYFLNPKLQTLINQNGQFNQNLLSNDLYALVVTIIVIQTDQYITDIQEEISNTIDVYLRDIITIKSLTELIQYRLNIQIIETNNQINLQDHCYKKLNENELKENQKYQYMSWIGLYYYYKSQNPNSYLQNQLINLIKRNLKSIYENFNYYLGHFLYNMKLHNTEIKLLHPLDILKNKKHLNLQLKEMLIEVLFRFGYTEQIIVYARKILQTEYSQLIHLKLIDSYYRAFMINEAQIELQNFTQGLVFDQLNTSIQEQYLHHIDYLKKSNFQQQFQIQLEVQQVLSTYGTYKYYQDIDSLVQDYKIIRSNQDGIIEALINILTENLQKYKITSMQTYIKISLEVGRSLLIDMYLKYLQNVYKLRVESLDNNLRTAILFEAGEIQILLNKSQEIKSLSKKIKYQIFQGESYQQIISLQILYLVLKIFQSSQNQRYSLDINLFKLSKQIRLVKNITYPHYKHFITTNLLNCIKYICIFHLNSTNVYINYIIEFSLQFALENQYHVRNYENLQLYHIQAQVILLQSRNLKRVYEIVKNNEKSLNNTVKRKKRKNYQDQITLIFKQNLRSLLSIETSNRQAIKNMIQDLSILNNYLYG